MATEKQNAANQLNAQKCTGPRSEEGKARSSQNALKHGLDAKSEVLRCENRADYEALIAEFYVRYQPAVPEERGLVDMLIRNEWLNRRYMSIDAGVWERGFYDTGSTSLGLVFDRSKESFDKVGRRMNWSQRNYQSAMKQLREIQATRLKETPREPEAIPEAPPPEAEPDTATPSPAEEQRSSLVAATELAPETHDSSAVNHELVSFRPTWPASPSPSTAEPSTPAQPAEDAAQTLPDDPKKEDDPHIAA